MKGLDRLSEAMAVLDTLFDSDEAGQRQLLDRLRNEDPALAATVERLLEADRVEDDALRRPPPTPRLAPEAGGDDGEGAEDLSGQRLGVWRLIERIGQGGMGVVYRAERADGQFQQQCALKRIAIGLDHGPAQQRFLRERQILASLRHDNIAALIDGGVSERGEPWYAMELVEGTPLDRWCDSQRLDLRERVTLFRQVLDAVRYAHSRLVVHRDLKPSNILVTAEGRVKLLDFGVAKLVEEGAGASATIDFAMTPEYAAPEQIYGDTVGPAADLYSLGVLLYRLLAGASPYGEDGGVALMRRRLGRVRDEAEPLSQVAGRQSSEVTQARRLRPVLLRRSLRGALSAIVHTCLQHDPARRYLNVDALDDDLARWLEHRPVRAYRGHGLYRAGQFLRRNRTVLAVLGVVVAAIVAFTAYRSVQLAQVRHERDLYTQTFNFVTDVIARATAGPDQDSLTVRDAMELMLDELQRRELPAEVRVWLTGMISDVHTGARDLDAAIAIADRGIEAAEGVDPLVQARLYEGQALAHEIAGRHPEALAAIDAALALVEATSADSFQVAALARLLTTKVRYGHRHRLLRMDEVRPMLERAIALGDPGRRGPRIGAQERAQAQLALIEAWLLERDYAQASALLTSVSTELDRAGLLGNDLLIDTRIAVQRLVLGETELAMAALGELLAQWIARYGPEFRNVASVQAQYAEALERSGAIDAAIEHSEQARRIARRGDSTSMDVLDQDRLLARRLLRAGAVDRADELAATLIQSLTDRDEPVARASLAQAWLLRAEAAMVRNTAPAVDTSATADATASPTSEAASTSNITASRGQDATLIGDAIAPGHDARTATPEVASTGDTTAAGHDSASTANVTTPPGRDASTRIPEPASTGDTADSTGQVADRSASLNDVASAIAEAEAIVNALPEEAPGQLRAQRSLLRVQAEHCLLRAQLDCAERLAATVIANADSVLDDPHELLLARRAHLQALRSQPTRQAELTSLTTRYRNEGQTLFAACNPFVRVLDDARAIPGIQALATQPTCPAPPTSATPN